MPAIQSSVWLSSPVWGLVFPAGVGVGVGVVGVVGGVVGVVGVVGGVVGVVGGVVGGVGGAGASVAECVLVYSMFNGCNAMSRVPSLNSKV